jgi:phosphatidylglycerophosphate synthase
MNGPPWDQRLARVLVKPLARWTALRPNHITTLSLALAVASGGLYATGDRHAANWAALVFVLARFIDHADGELARLTGKTSRFGYYYDYVAGGLSSVALFVGLGFGCSAGVLGRWAVVIGIAAGVSALAGTLLGFGVDAQRGGEAGGYPGFAGFELEDGIYLIAPITWLGWHMPFLALAGLGQVVFSLWMLARLVRVPPPAAGRA